MDVPTYPLYRGLDRPLQFKGLIGPYIWWTGGLLVADLFGFAILFISGISYWICAPLTLLWGGGGLMALRYLSRHYGRHGWMKYRAARHIPRHIRSGTRRSFTALAKK